MISLRALLICVAVCLAFSQKAPPVWPETFTQRFVEEFFNNGTRHVTTGQQWYDAAHSRSRLDRANGAQDSLCNSVIQGNLLCTNLVVGGKRYLVFPQVKKGCYCCGAEHGCGILRRDWLNEAKYEGTQELSGQTFDKWSKMDGSDVDSYYATVDDKQIPRRLNEANTHIVEYLMNTFNTGNISDNIFDVPSYVTEDCPSTSKCAKFRQTGKYE